MMWLITGKNKPPNNPMDVSVKKKIPKTSNTTSNTGSGDVPPNPTDAPVSEESRNASRSELYLIDFIWHGLHRDPFDSNQCHGNSVHLVAVIPKEGGKKCTALYTNRDRKHAEEWLIEYINSQSDIEGTLTIYLSSSPCCTTGLPSLSEDHTCGKKLSELAIAMKAKVKLEVIFSSLHMLRRPSCPRYKCGCKNYIDDGIHKEGLKNLLAMHRSLTLRSIEEEDWEQLINLLFKEDNSVPHHVLRRMRFGGDDGKARTLEDECLKKDFEQLLEKAEQ